MLVAMTITRTDIHRPASESFDPEAYRCVGVFDTQPEWPGGRQDRLTAVNALVAQGYRSGAGNSNQCGHCGAHIRYAALMAREDVHEWIFVGETCLGGRFEMTKVEFDTLRKNAALNGGRIARRAKVEAIYAQYPDLIWATYAYNISEAGARYEEDENGYLAPVRNSSFADRAKLGSVFSIILDISIRVNHYGEVSEKQAALVSKLLVQVEQAEARMVAREAAQAALVAKGVAAPSGRIVVEGTVVAQKTVDGDYGVTFKMLVLADEGWKVWVSEPSAINPSKGDRVRFTATLTPSHEDVLFAFGSRPSKASIITVEV